MKIIAVDPGYDRVGIAVIERDYTPGARTGEVWVHSETFTTDKSDSINERLRQVGERVEQLCTEYSVEYLAIETLFFTNNQKTAMAVAQARGIIIYAAQKSEAQIMEFTPLQIKSAVAGNGRADKRAVFDMVQRLIKIPDGKRLDDEYDAIACGLTFFAHYRPKLDK